MSKLTDEALDMLQARAITAQQTAYAMLMVYPDEILALVDEVRELRQRAALADALGLISIADVAEALGIDPPDTTHELLMRLRAQADAPRPGLISIYSVAQALGLLPPPTDALDLYTRLRAYAALHEADDDE